MAEDNKALPKAAPILPPTDPRRNPGLHARLTHGPASVLGMVDRVIITDGGDMMCFEWTKQEGLSRQTKKAMQAIEAKNGVERT